MGVKERDPYHGNVAGRGLREIEPGTEVWHYKCHAFLHPQAKPTRYIVVGFVPDYSYDHSSPKVVAYSPDKLKKEQENEDAYHAKRLERFPKEDWGKPTQFRLPETELLQACYTFFKKEDAEYCRLWHLRRSLPKAESHLKSVKQALEEAEDHLSTSA